MKRYWIAALVAILATLGCDESKDHGDTCGDGILGENEICDGDSIRDGISVYCPNGTTATRSLLRCNACALDTTLACNSQAVSICGNGIVEDGEECDGSVPEVIAGCSDPDLSKLKCKQCKLVDEGVCARPSDGAVCGDGKVDSGELCDGSNIPAAARQCPANMVALPTPNFKCTSSCQLVDISEACVFGSKLQCGNGKLDANEMCDGKEFSESLVESIDCGAGKTFYRDRLQCDANCQIDTSAACVDIPYDGVLISELVPVVRGTSLAGIAIEIANRGKETQDLSKCSLSLFSQEKLEKSYSLASLGVDHLSGRQVYVVCSQADESKMFGDACDFIMTTDGILANLSGIVAIGLTCESDSSAYELKDLVNMNSFYAAITQGEATDFIRQCNAKPHTDSSTLPLMGEGWTITSYTTDAPEYNLGEHCAMEDADSDKIQCEFAISTHELTSRAQAVDMELKIKIPGITDKTDRTDASSNLSIEFVSGKITENADGQKTVSMQINHLANPKANEAWVSSDGFDSYIGVLRNWDNYEGFWNNETGEYVVDAKISFDNGVTNYYCGSQGLLKEYGILDKEPRERLSVSYEAGTCGDGVIDADEACDGTAFLPQAMTCDKEGDILLTPNKVTCASNCMWTITNSACGKPISTCGNEQYDSGEVCDGIHIPDEAKICDKGQVTVENPIWTCGDTCAYLDKSQACELACGNGKLDATVTGGNAEICDGDIIPDSAKICPFKMVPKDHPEWNCNSTCSGILEENACELACGNGKLDKNVAMSATKKQDEICDGTLFAPDYEATCKEGRTYDASRKRCNSKCELDAASCVPNDHIAISEYAIVTNEAGTHSAMAIAIELFDAEKMDASGCTLSFIDKNDKVLMATAGLARYALLDAAQSRLEDGKFILKPCEPLVFCSIPSDFSAGEDGQKIYQELEQTLLGGKCDATVSLPDSSKINSDFVFKRMDEIAHIQLTCGGEYMDFVDFNGLREDYKNNGKTHGKLKAADTRPWSSRESVNHAERMDTDTAFQIETFGTMSCKTAENPQNEAE